MAQNPDVIGREILPIPDRPSKGKMALDARNAEFPAIKPQIPVVCDLISDPHETIDLMQSDLTVAWVIGAALRPVFALAQSAKQYRHIRVGEEDFNGYV